MSQAHIVYLLVTIRAYSVAFLSSPLISFFVLRNYQKHFCWAIAVCKFLLNKVVFSDNQRTTLSDFRDRLLLQRMNQAVRHFFYFELILTLL